MRKNGSLLMLAMFFAGIVFASGAVAASPTPKAGKLSSPAQSRTAPTASPKGTAAVLSPKECREQCAEWKPKFRGGQCGDCPPFDTAHCCCDHELAQSPCFDCWCEDRQSPAPKK